MKALITTSSTTITWWLRRGSIGFVVVFMVAALGFGLAGALYLREPAQVIVPASSVNLYAPLDQHERHPTGFSNNFRPLDQHERHPAGFVNLYAPLDQHERHPAGLPNNDVSLDQHERHPDGFPKNYGLNDMHITGAKVATQAVPDAATQAVLDYLRVHAK